MRFADCEFVVGEIKGVGRGARDGCLLGSFCYYGFVVLFAAAFLQMGDTCREEAEAVE